VKECSINIIQEEDLNDMESFFEIARLPEGPIMLDKCSSITDVSLFVLSHLNIMRAQKGNKRYHPYMERLIQFKNSINLK